ncbi:hypothetical protein N7481_003833 [Penicillium waksmanii]|uniref:uncharacterized protein n=1 Tax=Penicillium waksmanii TaxID=69791 RepID=UPI002549A5E9|nr:uncharacterized protein N7481_003833 [Penicillium waksmanii]KAJ5988623.1 hypothetical protein N7481_003833 [Penicillium waksmanii]
MSATTDSPIPLITTFAPPAACFTNTWLIEYVSGTDYYDKIGTGTDTSWWMSLGPREQDLVILRAIRPVAQTSTTPQGYVPRAGTTSSTVRADGINAQGISIYWKSGDFAPKTTTAGTITSSPSSESTTGAAAQGVTHGTSDTLSTGAKAGIGVAAAVGAIMMVTIAILCWMVRRKKKNSKFEETDKADAIHVAPSASGGMQGPAELNVAADTGRIRYQDSS